MVTKRSVLVVDEMPETREVLRTVLQRRGVEIIEATEGDQGLRLAQQHRPDLIVLDLQVESACPQSTFDGFEHQSQTHHTPLVVLGNARRDRALLPGGEFVSKPYQYGTLIRKIEELLDQRVDSDVAVRHPRR
ncbi:MAG: response regulator [Planctomycetes bacterium]|nr:response regulator [Planctomycetota bacterium]